MEDFVKISRLAPHNRNLGRTLWTLASGLIMVFSLGSCGFSDKAPQSAYTTEFSISKSTAQDSHISCSSENAFSCNLRNFSPHIDNGSHVSEIHCQQVASGKKICAPVTVYQFNTSRSIAICENCSINTAQKRYQNTEAICVFQGLVQDNVYAVRGLGSDLNQALGNAYQACISSKDLRL